MKNMKWLWNLSVVSDICHVINGLWIKGFYPVWLLLLLSSWRPLLRWSCTGCDRYSLLNFLFLLRVVRPVKKEEEALYGFKESVTEKRKRHFMKFLWRFHLVFCLIFIVKSLIYFIRCCCCTLNLIFVTLRHLSSVRRPDTCPVSSLKQTNVCVCGPCFLLLCSSKTCLRAALQDSTPSSR